MNGKVFLVGAGPGDGGLLTLRGKSLIETADVIVFDRLVGPEILEMIPDGTETIDVGKNAGSHPIPQHEINRILLSEAKAGKIVVRLKGGDPFLFGRGGEELESLRENGIAFEVVPGITAAIAVPAYAGIPVTHRDFCSSLHIITGHAKAGTESRIDFESLVKLNGTLVFMMSVSTIDRIAGGLLDAGMSPDMPAAVTESGTLSRQRTFTSPLCDICKTVKENGVHSPAVLLVGRVCRLSDTLRWFDQKPLHGRRILVTQPAAGSSRLAAGLRDLGAEVILYPSIKTSPVRPLDVPQTEETTGDPFDTVVFTSGEGVRSYCSWLLETGHDMRTLSGKKIACIGSATAAALQEYGLIADFIPAEYSGLALGQEMIRRGFVDENSRVLLLRTTLASQDVTDALRDAGIPFTDCPVYETHILSNPPLEEIDAIDSITFTSRSCVEGFLRSQTKTDFSGIPALCIGGRTAAAAASCGFEIIVSEEATIDSMLSRAIELKEIYETKGR